jgi:hypothetical protein
VAHALNDNLVVGDAVKNQIGIRAESEPPHAWKVGRLPRVRVLFQQKEKRLNPLANMVCPLGRIGLDVVERLLDLRRRTPCDA